MTSMVMALHIGRLLTAHFSSAEQRPTRTDAEEQDQGEDKEDDADDDTDDGARAQATPASGLGCRGAVDDVARGADGSLKGDRGRHTAGRRGGRG